MTEAVAAFPPSFIVLAVATFGAVVLGYAVSIALLRIRDAFTWTRMTVRCPDCDFTHHMRIRCSMNGIRVVDPELRVRYLNREIEQRGEPQT